MMIKIGFVSGCWLEKWNQKTNLTIRLLCAAWISFHAS